MGDGKRLQNYNFSQKFNLHQTCCVDHLYELVQLMVTVVLQVVPLSDLDHQLDFLYFQWAEVAMETILIRNQSQSYQLSLHYELENYIGVKHSFLNKNTSTFVNKSVEVFDHIIRVELIWDRCRHLREFLVDIERTFLSNHREVLLFHLEMFKYLIKFIMENT